MALVLFVGAAQETPVVFELKDQDILVSMVQKLTVAVAAGVKKQKHMIRRCGNKLHIISQ
jgi:hypothetical protein